jgi:hypothetical protein
MMRRKVVHDVIAMDPRERATHCWYRVAGLVSREQKELAIEILEAEIRSAQHEVLLDAARITLGAEPPIEAAQARRAKTEKIIRPE